MRLFRIVFLVCLVSSVILFAVPVIGSEGTATYKTNESVPTQNSHGVHIAEELQNSTGEVQVLVEFPDQKAGQDIESLKSRMNRSQIPLTDVARKTEGIAIENQFWLVNAALVTVDTDVVPVDILARIDGVSRIDTNTAVTALASGTAIDSITASATPKSGTTYGLDQINATSVWQEYETRGEGVRVAVLDTGIDNTHPDIDLYTEDPGDPTYPGGWAEFDAEGNRVESEPHDASFHGTHVSGIVAGGNASGQHIGVAPDVELLHGAVLNDCSDQCQGTFAQVIAGMEWAVENDADVVTLSLGTDGYIEEYVQIIQNAEANGVTVVASIGNSYEGTSASPGNVYDTLSVGAANESLEIAEFSGGEVIDTGSIWGDAAGTEDWPDQYTVPTVTAPGVDVLSTIPDSGWARVSGTSMAAPYVAGTVALLQSVDATRLSPEKIRTGLEATAWRPAGKSGDSDSRYGSGIVDAWAAIAEVVGEPKAAFTVTDANYSSSRVLENESVTVTATVENTGLISGAFTAGLRVNGAVEDIASVTVPAGDTRTVSFNLTLDTRGTYDLAINDTAVGTVVVERPATFLIDDLAAPAAKVQNESVDIVATVRNDGDLAGSQNVSLLVDGEVRATRKNITLAARTLNNVGIGNDDSVVTRESLSTDAARTIEDNVMTADGRNVVNENGTIVTADGIAITDETGAPVTVEENGTVTVTREAGIFSVVSEDGRLVAATETGETVNVTTVDGSALLREEKTSLPEVETLNFDVSLSTPGNRTLAVTTEDRQVSTTVSVLKPASFAVSGVMAPDTVDQNVPFEVSANVRNTGEVEGTRQLALTVDGENATSKTVTLAPGVESTVTFENVTIHPYGERKLSVTSADGAATTNLTVEPGTLNASFTYSPAEPTINKSVIFDASPSTGAIERYEWRLRHVERNETVETSTDRARVNLTFESVGEWEITLTLVDSEGHKVSQNVTTEVTRLVHPSGVDQSVAETVATLAGSRTDITGADLTILRGGLLDGANTYDGVTVTGADFTLLRGWLLDGKPD